MIAVPTPPPAGVVPAGAVRAADAQPAGLGSRPAATRERPKAVLSPWLRSQAISTTRHAAALAPFKPGEFGTGAAAPSDGHLVAVNELIEKIRSELLKVAAGVRQAEAAAQSAPSTPHFVDLVTGKEHAHDLVRQVEKVWNFYLELFGQRQSKFADWLLSTDRIARDCYSTIYTRLGVPRSVPAPPPFTYMQTGFSPATFRRGIRLSKIGRQINPFPLIQIPYHRLINPWTLGAVLHEVSHNLQSDLDLSRPVPRRMARVILAAGLPRSVAMTWARWNREIFADLSAVLLGGPAVVGSLMDVVGRSPEQTLTFVPGKPHPTPYLRVLISCELLRRMQFEELAERYRRAWMRIYRDPYAGTIPPPVLDTFEVASAAVVDAVCFQPFDPLGKQSLAKVTRFRPEHQMMVEEAARRLAAGTDPGIVPSRFLVGAAREALDRKLARPGVIATKFYQELVTR